MLLTSIKNYNEIKANANDLDISFKTTDKTIKIYPNETTSDEVVSMKLKGSEIGHIIDNTGVAV